MQTNHGFTYEWEYQSDNGKPIKHVVTATVPKKFVSLGQKTLRLWDQHRDYEVLKLERDNFVRVVLALPGRRIYLAAALDMKFKIYDANLFLIGQFAAKTPIKPKTSSLNQSSSSSQPKQLKVPPKTVGRGKRRKKKARGRVRSGSGMGTGTGMSVGMDIGTSSSGQGSNSVGAGGGGGDVDNAGSIRAVLCMFYDAVHDEIVTGGLSGCQRWRLSGDRFHTFTFIHLQTLANSEGKWIDRMCDAKAAKRLFCCHGDSVTVYSFNYVEGQRVINGKPRARVATLTKTLRAIHEHSITGCLYNDVNSYLITSSLDLAVKVWSAASSYSLVHTFSGHSKSVTGLLSHPYPSLILSCSLDCTLRVWNLDTLEEEYHLETMEPVQGMELGNAANHILVMTPTRVVSWRLHHIVTLFALCRSPVIALDCVPPPVPPPPQRTSHLIVTRSRDHSVRVLTLSGDCLCTLLPDSAVTAMIKVLYDPVSQMLLGLLGPTGDVFAYSTRLGPMAILQWKVGAQIRLNHDKVNDIALCRLRLNKNGMFLVGATSKGSLYVWRTEEDTEDDGSSGSGSDNAKSRDEDRLGCTRLVQSQAVHKDAISTIMYNDASRNIVCFVPSAGILLVDDQLTPLRTLSIEGTPFYKNRKMTPTTCVHMGRDRSLVLLGLENGSFQIFDVDDQSFDRNRQSNVASFEHDAAITAASFFIEPRHKGLLVATGGRDGCLKFWDINKQLMCELPLTAALNAVCFLPNGDIIFGEGQHVAKVKASMFGLKQMSLIQELSPSSPPHTTEGSNSIDSPAATIDTTLETTEQDTMMVTGGTNTAAVGIFQFSNSNDEPGKLFEEEFNINSDEQDILERLDSGLLGVNKEESVVVDDAVEDTNPSAYEAARPTDAKPARVPFRFTNFVGERRKKSRGLPVSYGRMIRMSEPPIGGIQQRNTQPQNWKHPLTQSKEDSKTLLEHNKIKNRGRVTFKAVRRRKMQRSSKGGTSTELSAFPLFPATRSGAFLPAFLPFSALPPSLERRR
jgi:WD40 repeat protein